MLYPELSNKHWPEIVFVTPMLDFCDHVEKTKLR
jgi:hypothetical protein